MPAPRFSQEAKRKILAEYIRARETRQGNKVLEKYRIYPGDVSDWFAAGLDKVTREEAKKATRPLRATLAEIAAARQHDGRHAHYTDEQKQQILAEYYQARTNGGQGREVLAQYGFKNRALINQWKKEFGRPVMKAAVEDEMEVHEDAPEPKAETPAEPVPKGRFAVPARPASEYTRLERAVLIAQHAALIDRDDRVEFLKRTGVTAQTLMGWRNARPPETIFDEVPLYANKPVYTNAHKKILVDALLSVPEKTRPIFIRATGIGSRQFTLWQDFLSTPGEAERRRRLLEEYAAVPRSTGGGLGSGQLRTWFHQNEVDASTLSRWYVEEYGHLMKGTQASRRPLPEPRAPVVRAKARPVEDDVDDLVAELHPPRSRALAKGREPSELEELRAALKLHKMLLAQAEAEGFTGRKKLIALLGED